MKESDAKKLRDYLISEKGYALHDVQSISSEKVAETLLDECNRHEEKQRQESLDRYDKLNTDGKIEALFNGEVPIERTRTRRSPAENHPSYSHSERLDAISKLLGEK